MQERSSFFKLTLIIPFFSDKDDLTDCLSALEESYQLLSNQEKERIEILVVDDASPLPPKADSFNFSIKIYRLDKNHGVGYARNQGIRRASTDWFCCLDSDVLVRPEFLRKLLFKIDSKPKAPIIQGVVYRDPKKFDGSLFPNYLALYNLCDSYSYVDSEGFSTLLCSGCFASTKTFFKTINFFCKKYQKSGGEEFEILSRLPPNSIYQDNELKVDHAYDTLCRRLKKVWHRSHNYTETALQNEQFDSRLKRIGVLRVLVSTLATVFLFVSLFEGALFLILFFLLVFSLMVVDGGRQYYFLHKEMGLRLTLLAPIFMYLEYLTASVGALSSWIRGYFSIMINMLLKHKFNKEES